MKPLLSTYNIFPQQCGIFYARFFIFLSLSGNKKEQTIATDLSQYSYTSKRGIHVEQIVPAGEQLPKSGTNKLIFNTFRGCKTSLSSLSHQLIDYLAAS